MRKLFVYGFLAERMEARGSGTIHNHQINAGLVEAASTEEAEGQVLKIARRDFSVKDGWRHHAIRACEVSQDLIDKYASRMREDSDTTVIECGRNPLPPGEPPVPPPPGETQRRSGPIRPRTIGAHE